VLGKMNEGIIVKQMDRKNEKGRKIESRNAGNEKGEEKREV
jgi:hypothetical protein